MTMLKNVETFVNGTGAGFKEWFLVCSALGSGKQHVIVRKGGLAEGQAGFAFKHQQFALFPTFYHAQRDLVRSAPTDAEAPEPENPDEVVIRFFVETHATGELDHLGALESLEPFHVWEPSVMHERFVYGEPAGVHVASVRIYRLSEPWRFPNEKRFGGCRSWVTLPPAPPEIFEALAPVVADETFDAVRRAVDSALQRAGAKPLRPVATAGA